jgi:hypothetical protein
MLGELEIIFKEVVLTYLRYYSAIFLAGVRHSRQILARTAGVSTVIRTGNLWNASIERYRCCSSPLGCNHHHHVVIVNLKCKETLTLHRPHLELIKGVGPKDRAKVGNLPSRPPVACLVCQRD